MKRHNFFLIAGILMPFFIYGQNVKDFIPLDNTIYNFIDYAITSGRHIPQFVLNQPYRLNEIKFNNKQPSFYFEKYWEKVFKLNKVNFYLSGYNGIKKDKNIKNRFRASGGVIYSDKYISLKNTMSVDQNYKNDPKFAGDLSEADHWLYGRIEQAYIDIHLPKFEIFFGRISRNWGALNDFSLILSNNPYTYDHLLLSLHLKKIKFSLIYAQLDNYYPVYSFKNPNEPINNVKRNLVGHRLDIHISNKLQIAFTEMATYGGKNRPFEWAFMNPMNLYYPIQRNDKKEMDGYWCVDLFFKPFPKSALWGQFLIDDIIVNNDPGINDRKRYPDRLGLLVSLRVADMFFNGGLWSLSYVRIWNRTYESKFTWQNYHYRGYSLGYPASSLEELKFKFSFWHSFPIYISNEINYGRYGATKITDIFPLQHEPFPVPPVIHNLIDHFVFKYFYSERLKFLADIYYRQNPTHYSNRFEERSKWVFQIGLTYFFNLSFNFF